MQNSDYLAQKMAELQLIPWSMEFSCMDSMPIFLCMDAHCFGWSIQISMPNPDYLAQKMDELQLIQWSMEFSCKEKNQTTNGNMHQYILHQIVVPSILHPSIHYCRTTIKVIDYEIKKCFELPEILHGSLQQPQNSENLLHLTF